MPEELEEVEQSEETVIVEPITRTEIEALFETVNDRLQDMASRLNAIEASNADRNTEQPTAERDTVGEDRAGTTGDTTEAGSEAEQPEPTIRRPNRTHWYFRKIAF